jgi:hypothetical protein
MPGIVAPRAKLLLRAPLAAGVVALALPNVGLG